jgi:hypothetical protein
MHVVSLRMASIPRASSSTILATILLNHMGPLGHLLRITLTHGCPSGLFVLALSYSRGSTPIFANAWSHRGSTHTGECTVQPILTISTNMRRCTVIGMTMLQLGAIDNKRLAWILLDYERLSFLYANLASGLVAVCLD